MKIAILYICTGKYSIFWENFYKSSEQYFLCNCTKEYFVFTDQILSPINNRIHIIEQEKLGWPLDTLLRFHMFIDIEDQLAEFDYIFFLNANMIFVADVREDILPVENGLLAVLHPGFFNKKRELYTYETDKNSLACIPHDEGKHYFMGSFNGGKSKEYIELIRKLVDNIEKDLENDIVAIWHDESHLNHYLLDKPVKILSPSYAFAEGWALPFEKKIVILDKNKFGGHNYLRDITTIL